MLLTKKVVRRFVAGWGVAASQIGKGLQRGGGAIVHGKRIRDSGVRGESRGGPYGAVVTEVGDPKNTAYPGLMNPGTPRSWLIAAHWPVSLTQAAERAALRQTLAALMKSCRQECAVTGRQVVGCSLHEPERFLNLNSFTPDESERTLAVWLSRSGMAPHPVRWEQWATLMQSEWVQSQEGLDFLVVSPFPDRLQMEHDGHWFLPKMRLVFMPTDPALLTNQNVIRHAAFHRADLCAPDAWLATLAEERLREAVSSSAAASPRRARL